MDFKNSKVSKNHRDISVTSTMNRLYRRVLRDLIEKDFRENEEEEQNGFHVGRLCTDVFFTLNKL